MTPHARPVTPRIFHRLIVAAGLLSIAVAGCRPEEKIVRYKPFFAGLENAQSQTIPVAEQPRGPLGETIDADEEDFSLVVENPDGTKTLISRNGQHLMYHIHQTLAEGDVELFTEQVLSEATRQEYIERGLDPADAFKTLKPHQRDIGKLFARMPMGENSPNVMLESVGKNIFRIRLTGPAARDLPVYRGFDMILEEGNWRLRWFVK